MMFYFNGYDDYHIPNPNFADDGFGNLEFTKTSSYICAYIFLFEWINVNN